MSMLQLRYRACPYIDLSGLSTAFNKRNVWGSMFLCMWKLVRLCRQQVDMLLICEMDFVVDNIQMSIWCSLGRRWGPRHCQWWLRCVLQQSWRLQVLLYWEIEQLTHFNPQYSFSLLPSQIQYKMRANSGATGKGTRSLDF